LRILESKVLNNNLNLCIIKSPGFSTHRKNLLEDIALFTGTTVIKNHQVPFIIGKLESCTISHNQSILLKDKSINIDNVIKNLENYSKQDTIEKIDKDLLLERIENLKGKISVIKVGGQSELEMKERYDRYDDAIRAVTCALEEGIVEGGGEAFYKQWNQHRFDKKADIDMNVEEKIIWSLYNSILMPYYKIKENKNIDVNLNFPVDRFKENIIDPLKVTRTALENAVAVAKTILSTNAVVLNSEQWNS
jgi:chaperonin GroEL